MSTLIETLKPASAETQHQQLLTARKAGKAPRIFFERAGEIDWVPANTPTEAFRAALRPPLDEREMQAFTGIPIHTFDMSLLPHDSPTRGRLDYFSPQELAVREEVAARQLETMRKGYGDTKHLSQLRGQAIQGAAMPISHASPAQLARPSRLEGDAVYVEALYYSTEKLRRSTPQLLNIASLLEPPDLSFVPNSSDFFLIGQLHELTHPKQRIFLEPPSHTIYREEEDADTHGYEQYLAIGGSPSAVLTRLAARSTFHVLNFNSGDDMDSYGFYPALLGRDTSWSMPQAAVTRYDLQIRMGAEALGLKYAPQPEDMLGNIKSFIQNKPVRDLRFIDAVTAFNQFIHQPDCDRRAPVLLEKVWYSGAKLHRDTLRVAGIAVEALNLFRHGPG